jgi:hypothetical protein
LRRGLRRACRARASRSLRRDAGHRPATALSVADHAMAHPESRIARL